MHKLTSSVTGTMARMQAMAQSQSGGGAASGPMGARMSGASGRISNMRTAFAVSVNSTQSSGLPLQSCQ